MALQMQILVQMLFCMVHQIMLNFIYVHWSCSLVNGDVQPALSEKCFVLKIIFSQVAFLFLLLVLSSHSVAWLVGFNKIRDRATAAFSSL